MKPLHLETTGRSLRAAVVVVGIALLAAAVAGGVTVGRRLAGPPEAVAAASAERRGTPVPPGFTSFEGDGFSIAYPGRWRRMTGGGPQVQLAATPNGKDSLLVRVVPLPAPVNDRDLPAMRRLADAAVAGGKGVRMLAMPERIELDGVPGYFYFYSFRDAETGRRGTHSHYLLFDRNRMIAIVLQALPARRFHRLGPTFDDIVQSFTILGH